MIAKFLLRRLPCRDEQDSFSFAREAANVARHARPADWAALREELAAEADTPATGTRRASDRSDRARVSPGIRHATSNA